MDLFQLRLFLLFLCSICGYHLIYFFVPKKAKLPACWLELGVRSTCFSGAVGGGGRCCIVGNGLSLAGCAGEAAEESRGKVPGAENGKQTHKVF